MAFEDVGPEGLDAAGRGLFYDVDGSRDVDGVHCFFANHSMRRVERDCLAMITLTIRELVVTRHYLRGGLPFRR